MLEPMHNLTDEHRRTMAGIGPIWGQAMQKHRDMTAAIYAPLIAASPKDGVTVTRDFAYGPHPRHTLDVFRPAKPPGGITGPLGGAAGAPVVLFVHGGAFLRGAKYAPAEGVYDNVLTWFARQGYLGVNMEYRLAPDSPYPGGAEDVAGAVNWITAHAAEHGGNPQQIWIVGHSAGATHICTYANDPAVAVKPGPEVKGLVLISGRLRIDVLPENPNAKGVRAYFGEDESLYEERSPVTHAHLCKLPVMIAIGQYENPLLDIYGAEFFWRLANARRHAPRLIRMRRHNHTSMAFHFNTGEEILGQEILGFFRDGE